MFDGFRYKYAFVFGNVEHTASRILFAMLIITLVCYRAGWDITLFLTADILIWLVYYIAHLLEKALHPKH